MSDTISPQNGWFPVRGQQQNRAMLVTGILCLCIVSAIFIILHLYVRYVLCRRNDPIIILRDGAGACGPPELGLDVKVIAALPTFAYHPATNRCGSSGEEGEALAAECAVCLSVVEEGEVVRLLPNCRHVFHVDCIDVWLHSHPTCPVCRADAVPSEAGKGTAPPPPAEVYRGGGPSGPALEGMPDSKEGVSVTSRLGSSLRRMWSRERSERRIQMDGVEDLEGQY